LLSHLQRYWEYEELEKGNIHKHCAYCVDSHCERYYESFRIGGRETKQSPQKDAKRSQVDHWGMSTNQSKL
jgi:hypothetical protein